MSQPDAAVSIACDGLSAQIDPLGAQLSALRDAEGRDLLWDGDPQFWTGRAPILFPVVGELNQGRYRFDGRTYHLPRHGFARRKLFQVVASSPSAVTFRLQADDQTLEAYPFQFQLDLEFSLSGSSLTMTAGVTNLGDTPMPASLGFHPAFRWPLPYGAAREAHGLHFELPEEAPLRRIDSHGLVEPETYPTPVNGQDLSLADDLFAHDALVFDALQSSYLTYGAQSGPKLKVDLLGAPYLGVWTKPGAPFVCIEPWHGIADAEGFDGDLRDKRGVFIVAPGQTQQVAMKVTLEA